MIWSLAQSSSNGFPSMNSNKKPSYLSIFSAKKDITRSEPMMGIMILTAKDNENTRIPY